MFTNAIDSLLQFFFFANCRFHCDLYCDLNRRCGQLPPVQVPSWQRETCCADAVTRRLLTRRYVLVVFDVWRHLSFLFGNIAPLVRALP